MFPLSLQSQSLLLEGAGETQLHPRSPIDSPRGPSGFLLTPSLVARQLWTVAGA